MKVSLTTTDFQAALVEFQEQTGIPYQVSESESALILPTFLGQGQVRNIDLRQGAFNLFYNQQHLVENLVIAVDGCSPSNAPVALEFCLAGPVGGAIQGVAEDLTAMAGDYGLVYCADRASHVEFLPGRDISIVEIVMTPQFFQTLLGADPDLAQFQQILDPDRQSPYWKLGKTTPLMAIALQQILNCPYQGAIRHLYLESKCLELLTLTLEQLKTTQPKSYTRSPQYRALSPEDILVIEQARDILVEQFQNPPSLLSLARQVGINDCKLKRGFRQVFGTTVFGYLHDHRMEQAAKLLQKNYLTVTGVANAIGFANRSAFATAFRRKHGVNPSEYRAAYRREYWQLNVAQRSG